MGLEEALGAVALAEHHVVLQEAVVTQRCGDLRLAQPVGDVLAVLADQHVTVEHAVVVVDLAEEPRVVGMLVAGLFQDLVGKEGRADRADVLLRTRLVRPDDERRFMLSLHLILRSLALRRNALHVTGAGIDRIQRRQVVAEENDDRLPVAFFRPVHQHLEAVVSLLHALRIGGEHLAIGFGKVALDLDRVLRIAVGLIRTMALQGHREKEEGVLHFVRLADDFLRQGLVRREDAALLHGRHVLFRPEHVETEGLVDGCAVPEPPLERVNGARNITLAAEERGERGNRIADILLVGDAAIGQERVGKTGQRFEFDIGGHAAELRRKDVAALQFTDGRHGIGRQLHLGKTGRIPKGFAHQHDHVRFAAMGRAGGKRLYRNPVDRVRHIAGGRVYIGHREVDGKGKREAVMAVVLGLIPHDRDDPKPVTDPRELVVVHDVPECDQQRQGECDPHQPLPTCQLGKVLPGEPQQESANDDGRDQPGDDADRGPRPVLHEYRHQFHDLPAEKKIGRIERIGQEDLLLLTDECRHDGERRDEQRGLVFATEQGIDAKHGEEEHGDRGPGRAHGIGEIGDGVGPGPAHDHFDGEDERYRNEKREERTAGARQGSRVSCGRAFPVGVDLRAAHGGIDTGQRASPVSQIFHSTVIRLSS
ncbi:Phosphoglycerol transferase, cyclic beta-1,2-glucan modification protein [Sinorhizobium meliloti 1021]|uniref:Phosphoglycerol transferase, cyclic beta-1,2-glucan modification protein n=2 Tax=Rhizobium meliloti TaxID=382 RepID=Q7APD2_RHIME|nr:cyclic beta-1,2-glucan modification protein [Sinorhizobium meliloti]AGG74432.1 Phosphoglycerol transferase,cyclic beta-1,2-glucan modification protein [Sinorhizobium meliloti 2011]CAC46426.1 Phosphoglycerol transferase, cyclic beta-1,2-glucan modification protein [Sinorhizobium meliloti 1021]